MRERVDALIEKHIGKQPGRFSGGRPFIGTFHVFGSSVIRAYPDTVGIKKSFTILDRDDAKKILKEAMEQVSVNPKEFEPNRILSAISKFKNLGRVPSDVLGNIGNSFVDSIVARCWDAYETLKRKQNSLDFDDLITESARLLHRPEIRDHYQAMFSHVHIDEYQDTNHVQYQIGSIIAGKHHNICAVGDIDQTIYTWRGADISNILNFEREYPTAKVILLEQNYRSTKTIIEAANKIIEKNTARRKKTLFTENSQGDPISLYGGYDEIDEAHFIALKAKELIGKGVAPDEIAVLYRANFQSRTLEEAFLAHNVQHAVLGTRFYDRKEVKDTLSYLKAALNPESTTEIKRIINVPARGIGKISIDKILNTPIEQLELPLQRKYQAFLQILGDIRRKAADAMPSETVGFTLKASGMLNLLQDSHSEEDKERLQNLKEIVSLAARYDEMGPEGMTRFLEDACLMSDQDSLDQKPAGVRLMTVHASKGLEFDHVFISGLEDGLFPQTRDEDVGDSTKGKDRAEEERRLFYVALTRAKKKIFLSFASIRMIFGNREATVPSRYMSEIDEKLLTYEERLSERKKERTIFFD